MKENSEAYEQFVNEVTETIRQTVGKEYRVIARKERKNNAVVLDGVMLQRGRERVAANVYLNHYYPKYCNGESVTAIAEQVLALCEEKREEMKNLAERLDFSETYIREHLYYRLVSRERNIELLQEIPHRVYLNLAIVYYWVVYEEEEQIGSIMMTQGQMERLGWTEDELMQMARQNTPRIFPMSARGIEEIVGDLMLQSQNFSVLVISNDKGINGAACLMYPGILEELKQRMKGSFYILPSSIHELIVIPDNGTPPGCLCEMVTCINHTQLPPEDILSDAVYFYSEATGELQMIEMEKDA